MVLNAESYVNILDKQFNVKGDGITNDTTAINDVIKYVYDNGGGSVYFPKARYIVRRSNPRVQGNAINLLSGVSLIGDNAELILRDNATFIGGTTTLTDSVANIIADVKYGTNTLAIDNALNFNIGDIIFLRIGDNEWDKYETKYYDYARIVSIPDSQSIVINKKILTSMLIANTEVKNKMIVKVKELIKDITISGFKLINDINNYGNAESGINLKGAQNCKIENINSENPGAGAILLAYSKNIYCNLIHVSKSIRQNQHLAKGRVVNIWNCNNISFNNIYGEYFEDSYAFVEGYCKNIIFNNVFVQNNSPNKIAATNIFALLQQSSININNMTIEGNGNFNLVDSGGTSGNCISIKNLTLKLDKQIKSSPKLNYISETFINYQSDGSIENYYMGNSFEDSLTIELTDSMYNDFYLSNGLAIRLTVETSPNVSSADITGLYIGREKSNGTNIKDKLLYGKQNIYYDSYGTDYPLSLRTNERIKVLIITPKSGISNQNKKITIRYTIVK